MGGGRYCTPRAFPAYTVGVGTVRFPQIEWGLLCMCCWNGCNSVSSFRGCRCGCRSDCDCRCCERECRNNGVTALSAFSELSRLSEDSGASTAGWPVYVSYPAFLWDSDDETDCGCTRCS